MSVHSKQPEENKEEHATLGALTVDCDCVLDFSLELDSYDRGHSKTNKVLSVLIEVIVDPDGSVTNELMLQATLPCLICLYNLAQWGAPLNTLTKVLSFSDSLRSALANSLLLHLILCYTRNELASLAHSF